MTDQPETAGASASDYTTLVADYAAMAEFLYLTPVGIIKFRPDGVVEMANPAAAQLLMPLAVGGDMSNLYDLLSTTAPDLRNHVERFEASAGLVCEKVQLVIPRTHAVLTLGINKVNAATFMAVVQDITRSVEQEARISNDQQRFRAIFDNIRDCAICTVGLDGRVEEWNRSLGRQGGWEPVDTVDASFDIFFPPRPTGQPEGEALLDRARLHGTAEYEGLGVRRNGSTFWSNSVATALPDRDGNVSGFVVMTRDVSERKQQEDRLIVLATTDPLTGANNRRAGWGCLEAAFGRWKRYGHAFALLMIDCDHFKSINDRYGHDGGDAVLVALVQLCRASLRETDIIIRWGGEEFLLLLLETNRELATAAAERLRSTVETATIEHGSETIQVTISIGIAEPEDADATANDAVQRADNAMYRAKRAGRNRMAVG